MNLQKHFKEVKDFRVKGRYLHELTDILPYLIQVLSKASIGLLNHFSLKRNGLKV